MSEERMRELAQEALQQMGIDDEITVAGQFSPRGRTGAGFVGGMLGSDLGGTMGSIGDAVGVVAGYEAGTHLADAESGMPSEMIVGVSATHVYGFASGTRHSTPTGLVFQVPRSNLSVKVHQRVNVRILELIDGSSGSRIELEGNRIPLTHSKDVISELS
jgi:hypothetical protein